MQFTISVVLGLILGFILLSVTQRAKSTGDTPSAKPAWPVWLILALGAISAVIFGAGFARMVDLPGIFIIFVITLPVATVVLGVGSLIRGERRWPVWIGLILALLPVLFWIYFVIGEITGPAH